jgi:hypothetical protein
MSDHNLTDLESIYLSLGIDDPSVPIPPHIRKFARRMLKRSIKEQLFETPYEEEQGDDAFFIVMDAFTNWLIKGWKQLAEEEPTKFEIKRKFWQQQIPVNIADLKIQLADPVFIHAHVKYEIAHWEKALDVINNMSLPPLM